jgi:hypothetical protein
MNSVGTAKKEIETVASDERYVTTRRSGSAPTVVADIETERRSPMSRQTKSLVEVSQPRRDNYSSSIIETVRVQVATSDEFPILHTGHGRLVLCAYQSGKANAEEA